MNCTSFEECLFAGLDGEIEVSVRERMKQHSASCRRCRELERLVSGEDPVEGPGATPASEVAAATAAEPPAIDPPDDLVDAVLARTSGGSCERVAWLLSERFAASGDETGDADLLSMHLESCADCATLSLALQRLHRELPGLAELQPDDRFVADVMAATVGAAVPTTSAGAAPAPAAVKAPRPLVEWWASVAAFGERLAARPRLAFEGAFIATAMVFLVAGLPSPSMAELPARTFGQIGQGRADIESVALDKLGDLVDFGRNTWVAATERVTSSFPANESTSDEPRRFGDRFASWVTAGIELVDKLFRDFRESLTNLINTRRNA